MPTETRFHALRTSGRRARSWSLAVLLCVAICGQVAAQAPEAIEAASLAFAPAPSLARDDRAELELRVVPPRGRRTWMVTLASEGTAVEVVRGRLLPSDAVDLEARPILLRVPIVARGRGVALVHATLTGWSCEETCREVRLEATTTLHVGARRTPRP